MAAPVPTVTLRFIKPQSLITINDETNYLKKNVFKTTAIFCFSVKFNNIESKGKADALSLYETT